MPITIKYKELAKNTFDYPVRCFISGSSQSGKTYFARQLLENQHLFGGSLRQIVYHHPDYLEDVPISWHRTLDIPILYQSGLPTLSDICNLKPHTCIVLDDLFEDCINSTVIDYLFRVLSGKLHLSVLILSQRYFSSGKYGLNIRNNCNYTVLMRNVDAKLNLRIASSLGLKLPIQKAIEDTYDNNYWPYIFIDSTPRGQVSSYRCYIDIFSSIQIAFDQRGMKAYIISEKDFLGHFKLIGNGYAEKNGDDSKISISTPGTRKDATDKPEANYTQKISKRTRELRKRRRFEKNV